MLHVGDPVEKEPDRPELSYLSMRCFNDGCEHWYNKKDVINATSQMESLRQAGVDIEYGFLADRKSPIKLFKAGLKLRNLIKQRNIQAVHVLWGATSSLMVVLFSPVPVIVSFCGSDLYGVVGVGGKRTLSGRISRFLSQVSALGAQKVIVKSSQMKAALWAMSRDKTFVIPNGVDLEVFCPMEQNVARERLGWNLDEKIIIFFPGWAGPIKDQPLAEATVALVQKRLANVRLELLRGVPHEQLVDYYCAADLMLLTSFHEGSNNSVKEAMACNLPIVSVNCGDTKERLAGVCASHVIESRLPNDLADKVVEILSTRQRSNGRLHVAEISIPKIGHQVMAAYVGALGKKL